MRFYETRTFKKGLYGVLTIFALFVLTSLDKKSEEDKNEEINNGFSKEALIDEIKCQGFKYPDLILAQALLETGHFKSPVFKENNNTFGMRLPKVRQTLAKGSNLNHAVYSNWKESVEDRMIYENLYLNGKSRVKYKQYLDRVYAKGKNYTKTLEKIIKENNLKIYFEED
jgi:uncharacterized FlgJ-related protein